MLTRECEKAKQIGVYIVHNTNTHATDQQTEADRAELFYFFPCSVYVFSCFCSKIFFLLSILLGVEYWMFCWKRPKNGRTHTSQKPARFSF